MAVTGIPSPRALMMNPARQNFKMTGGKSFRQFPWWELRWRTTHTDWSQTWLGFSRSGSGDGTTGVWYYPITDPPFVNTDTVVKDFFEIGKPTLRNVYSMDGEEYDAFVARVAGLASGFGDTGSVSYHTQNGQYVAAWVSEGDGCREVVGAGYYAMSHGIHDEYPYSDGIAQRLADRGAADSCVLLVMDGTPTPEWDGTMSRFRCSMPGVVDCLVGYNTTAGNQLSFFRPFSSGEIGTVTVPYTLWSITSLLPNTQTATRQTTISQGSNLLGSSGSGMEFVSDTVITGEYNESGQVEASE